MSEWIVSDVAAEDYDEQRDNLDYCDPYAFDGDY